MKATPMEWALWLDKQFSLITRKEDQSLREEEEEDFRAFMKEANENTLSDLGDI